MADRAGDMPTSEASPWIAMPRTRTLVERLVAWRMPLLGLGVLLGVLAFVPAQRLEFDRSIEAMFAPSDPLLEPFAQLKRTFGAGELVLAAYDDPQMMTPAGVRRSAELAAELAAVPGVASVIGLHSLMGEAIADPQLPAAERLRELLEGFTHGADGRTAALLCILEPENAGRRPGAADDHARAVDRLRAIVESRVGGVLAGEPVMLVDGFRYVEQDGRLLGWTSALLLGATIVLCFRSIRWVLIPILVVQWTLLATRAVLSVSGLRLSMVSSMLAAIVTVVAVATVMHVIVRFREARAAGRDPRGALIAAGALLALPVTWAVLTDAVGFAALMAAEVGPVRDFGLMMAIGSLLVLPAMVLLIAGLALVGGIDIDPRRAWGEGWLDRGLRQSVHAVEHRSGWIAAATLSIAVFAGLGVGRLRLESDFTRNFRADSPVARSYEFVETRLGGAGMWDVILPAPERLTEPYLARVRRLEERLRTEVVLPNDDGQRAPGLTKVLSLAGPLEAMPGIGTIRVPLWLRIGLMRRRAPGLLETLHAEDPAQPGRYYYRIMLRAEERQPSDRKRSLIEQVERISREEFPGSLEEFAGGREEFAGGKEEFPGGREEPPTRVTGFFVLLTYLIDSVLRDQWIAFGIAALGIGAMMLLLTRSLALAAAALVPNVLPIVLVLGVLGWAGLRLNMGAAMIAAVSLGLSVDSSVHYLTAYRRLRGQGAGVLEAIDAAHQQVGRAIVFATLALVVGFASLVQSHFVPTIYFGVLVALSMLGGLLGNLVVLPLLLVVGARAARRLGRG